MPNTYSQITIQLVFATKGKKIQILPTFREVLHKYITGIITNQGQKLLAINSVHNHILIGQSTSICLSDLVREIKSESSRFINEQKLSPVKFYWQEGFGAFSYSKSHRDRVIRYIQNQEKHHRKQSFKDEYMNFLKKFEVDYNEKYLFEFYE
jgi:REP element-mobilizing transposase RayT